jgi:hypothetical protein
MIRDRNSDTDPEVHDATNRVAAVEKVPSAEKSDVRTDPGLDEEEFVRVLRALDQQSHLPFPIVDQRSCSDGGDFVAYVGTGHTAPSLAKKDEHRDRMLVELTALAGSTTTGDEEVGELAGGHVLPRFSPLVVMRWLAAIVVTFGAVVATVVLTRTRMTGAVTAAGLRASVPAPASEIVPASIGSLPPDAPAANVSPPAPAPSATSAYVSTSAATARSPLQPLQARPGSRPGTPAATPTSLQNHESFLIPDHP